MSNPNKLAWKGTPGEWHVHVTRRGIIVQGAEKIVCVIEALNPYIGHADAHMISAAPEAIEFLSDLLEGLDKGHWPDHTTITRAEEILKKAYNF